MLLVAAVAAAAGCVSQAGASVIIGSGAGQKMLQAEIADTPEKWARGLMNVASLPEDSGMLFVFPDSRPRSFWMKGTLIPLDIIFVSEGFRVVDIATLQPCREDPCPSYTSKSPARYVLEANAGYAAENGITEGDPVAVRYEAGQKN